MRPFKAFYLFFLMGLLVISCQKDTLEPVQEITEPTQEFTVPDIPDEIANLMSSEDLARFRDGPGVEYLDRLELSNARRSHGRWHPILMKLGYHLNFGPFVGESCDNPVPCYGPAGPTGEPGCENPANFIGITGMADGDGYWFSKQVHSEYYPVFCFPDYAGYGQGFNRLEDGMLWFQGESSPHNYDDEGNMVFYMKAGFVGDQSTGIFEGAFGWEIMISHTTAENIPSGGTGYSDVIIFGWVYLSS